MASENEEQVLNDVTNTLLAAQISDNKYMNKEAAQKARDHGWTAQQKFDYESYVSGAAEPSTWASNAQKYEWKDEYGDVGPEHKELEEILFKNQHIVRKGDDFEKLTQINVKFESQARIDPIVKFEDAGLHPLMLRNVQLCQYDVPTPIQSYVIPSVLQGKDVIGIAQTGSGKTAAFLIPILSKLMGKAKKLAASRPDTTVGWSRDQAVRAEPLVVIVVPTRELAAQIFNEACRLCYRTMLRPCVAYGGAPLRDQIDELQKGCDILVGTPGRVVDILRRPHVISMKRVRYTVIDEADELIQQDWQEDVGKIMGGDVNDDDDHVYMMFSATFPAEARSMAKAFLAKDHVRVRVGRAGSSHENIRQEIVFVDNDRKRECIADLLLSMPPVRTMIFVNNKKAADFLDDHLYNQGLPTTSIHADRTQREREDAVRAFKTGKAPIIITTGVSARGLDFYNLMHVINFDLPSSDHGGIDEYVHRIGRTARIGNKGMATSFYNSGNEDIAEGLVKLLKETNQNVPEFLEHYAPQDGQPVVFDDDSANEEDKEEDEAGTKVETDNGEASANEASSWGATKKEDDNDGWN